MKQKIVIAVTAAALVIAAAVASWFYLRGQDPIPAGSIIVEQNGSEQVLLLGDLKLTDVSGSIVNGKGEENKIAGKGIALAEITGESGFTEVKVTAEDAYSAVVASGEIGNAWLLVAEDSARLIVFGDQNAKRDVKQVTRIEVT